MKKYEKTDENISRIEKMLFLALRKAKNTQKVYVKSNAYGFSYVIRNVEPHWTRDEVFSFEIDPEFNQGIEAEALNVIQSYNDFVSNF